MPTNDMTTNIESFIIIFPSLQDILKVLVSLHHQAISSYKILNSYMAKVQVTYHNFNYYNKDLNFNRIIG